MSVNASVDVLGQVSLELLNVIGILLALEGFLVALLYSGTSWSSFGKKLLKVFIGVIAFSIVVTSLVSFGVIAGYFLFITVALIVVTASAVAVFVIIKA